jgi:hypothetical protein
MEGPLRANLHEWGPFQIEVSMTERRFPPPWSSIPLHRHAKLDVIGMFVSLANRRFFGGLEDCHQCARAVNGHHFTEIAIDLVRRRLDIIVATSIAAVLACKQATTVIPIVFPLAGDPLATGLVTSLARPGGNVTGLSNQGADLAGKRLEVLREAGA